MMGLNPSLAEQEQIAEALARHGDTLTPAERRAEAMVGGAFVIAITALVAAFPPMAEQWNAAAAIACVVALVAAQRAEFDMGSGFTVPVQLAFVPLLFAVPPSVAPLAVLVAMVFAYLPDVVRGEMRPIRLLRLPGSAWFSVGPAVVLSATNSLSPAVAGPAVLMLAVLAQLACDFGASAAMDLLVRGAALREQFREAWVYGVDLALTPIGLVIAWHIDSMPLSVLAAVPVFAVLGIFGRERRGRVESLVELNGAYRGTALLLGNVVEADDHYTGEHSRGVVELALAVGRRSGLDADRMRNLEFGALLHDVGKVAIPKEILNKPGKLDPDEWELMKTHAVEGQRMLDQIGGFMSTVGRIVRWHHERWDGGGYPDGLPGQAIPLESRIIAACDTWNAMTTTRPYRTALPAAVAADEMRRCAGTQLDPGVVGHLLAAVEVSQPACRDGEPDYMTLGVADTATPLMADV
jgi:HD-GYP domain-containing protein (c-di-GMP phosphodiesterase class II)